MLLLAFNVCLSSVISKSDEQQHHFSHLGRIRYESGLDVIERLELFRQTESESDTGKKVGFAALLLTM